jgi:hypothetical protein
MPQATIPETLQAIQGFNRYWIAVQLIVPPLLGFLVTLPFWRRAEMIFGSLIGSGIILASAIALILRDYVEVDRSVQACLDAGIVCWPEPSAFARFALHASIGLGQVFLLFALSLIVERRMRNRDYAPEWRR